MNPIWIAAASTAFNLVCNGTTTTTGPASAPVEKDFATVFRIDLSSERWCAQECKETNQIYSISNTKLVLKYVDSQDLYLTQIINRESGSYFFMINFIKDKVTVTATANCSVDVFTGFPIPKF